MKPYCLLSVLIFLLSIFSQLNQINGIGFVYPAVGVAVSAAYAGYEFVKGYATETCNTHLETREGRIWIRNDKDAFFKLKEKLSHHLYGQPLAKEIIVKALKSHLMDNDPSKALAMSFNGWSGVGKNYASQLIAKGLYKRGAESKFVHLLSSTNLFPDATNISAYKVEGLDTFMETNSSWSLDTTQTNNRRRCTVLSEATLYIR